MQVRVIRNHEKRDSNGIASCRQEAVAVTLIWNPVHDGLLLHRNKLRCHRRHTAAASTTADAWERGLPEERRQDAPPVAPIQSRIRARRHSSVTPPGSDSAPSSNPQDFSIPAIAAEANAQRA